MDNTNLSKNDLRVMEIIWEQGEATNSSILKCLNDEPNWSRYTVKTYITRLREKSFVGVKDTNMKTYTYYPLISKEKYLVNDASQYLNDHFNNLTHMVAGLVENEKISDEAIDDLEKYIKEIKAKKQR